MTNGDLYSIKHGNRLYKRPKNNLRYKAVIEIINPSRKKIIEASLI